MKKLSTAITVKDIINLLHTNAKIHIFDTTSFVEVISTDVFNWLDEQIYAYTIVDHLMTLNSELYIYAHVA